MPVPLLQPTTVVVGRAGREDAGGKEDRRDSEGGKRPHGCLKRGEWEGEKRVEG